jgi:hypothetical protein
MNYTLLKNLRRALAIFSAVSILAFTGSGQGTTAEKPPEMGESQAIRPGGHSNTAITGRDTEEQAEINSLRVRTGIGVVMELSAPLEVSCERMSALEKIGQGKPAEVKSEPTGSGTTDDQTARSEASQIAIPSHDRILTLKIVGEKVLIACNAASRRDAMQPAQPSAGPPPARAQ